MFLKFATSLILALTSSFTSIHAATPAIILPENGAKIAPGAQFAFKYNSIADYSVSSYNFTVVLFTQPPSPFRPSLNYAAGYTFGQFDVANYPAIPYARHPAPPYFVMPDFSKSLGGWGAGESVSNAIFYLAVFEEYANGQPSVGPRISLSINEIIYNSIDTDEDQNLWDSEAQAALSL
ncbi:hypothetical protein GYMLUDRAFT_229565 [Collybiopsis luxurians FD-317 M1]|uniref:Unplaced genomic scaffold GYMLUscaffold_44, whole genome shotgun sequence n=1 Tax=Collybiopsis luxurians FD-317 M1 TaxID=944289 RepID=A0A0D0BQ74_9AGAR|nr:hypothetical protein GYMLUDRAFT_229565 [Collybiopsis luxurians FD-317 M1]